LRSTANYLHWDADRRACCAAIKRTRATFKILLKTKDDPVLLERWIAHHRDIVGDGNIVIFDNMSNDDAVFRIYEAYRHVVNVFRFEGYCDLVHDVSSYPELYRALAESAEYFAFVDTDERLVLFAEDRWRGGRILSRFIEENRSADAFPATWLDNVDWSATRFRCNTDFDGLAGAIAWGKPILRATANLRGFLNHNIQLDQSLFTAPFRTNFFVLHLKNLFPEQRISANVNKLVARRFARAGESAEAICRRDLAAVGDVNTTRYVEEIRRLMPLRGQGARNAGPIDAGCLELRQDHSIGYFSEREKALVNGLIDDPRAAYEKAILRAMLAVQQNAPPEAACRDGS
jgi:hypothetical protein